MRLLKSISNRKYKSKYLSIGLLVIAPQLTVAGTDLLLTYPGDLIYEGPADQIKVGDPIGPSWVATGLGQMCNRSPNQDISTAYISPTSTTTGNVNAIIDGVSYTVFNTSAPGIGWVMSVKDTNAYNFTPLRNTANQWYPAPGTDNSERLTIGGNIKVTFIKVENRLITGTTVIPSSRLARISCFNKQGVEVDSAYINTPEKKIIITARACTLNTPKIATIDMGNFNAITLPNIGSIAGNKTHNILLDCDPNIALNATISDQINPSNRSTNASLSLDSTAAGVEVQVSYKNRVLSFGPDQSSAGQENQFYISNTGTGGITSIPLTFNYIRTGPLRAGLANALIGVTFSYQ